MLSATQEALMVEIGAKALYTVALLAIAIFCAREAWAVWFDRALQIGHFDATKDGADAASMADTFRRLVVQQQNVLFDLYSGAPAKPGEFRVSSGDVLTIHLSDLVRMPGSALDSLKIEAAGVNVTSILTTLRRWIVAPNEITGSVDQLDQKIYVSADWANAPNAQDPRVIARSLLVPPQTTLQNASFDLACRILFRRIPPNDVFFKDVDENDFCAFSSALSQFRSYLAARNVATDEAGTKAANGMLDIASRLIDRLTAANTTLIYAYKLGGYIELEVVASVANANASVIKPHLDKAQSLLHDYLKRLAALDPKANDPDVQERLASLATRGGAIPVAENFRQIDAVTFLKTVSSALLQDVTKSTPSTAADPNLLRPGASISAADSKTANALGFFVGKDNKRYFVSLSYVLGAIGSVVVSPALIDTAETHRPIGKVVDVDDPFALVEIADGVQITNDQIKEIASAPSLGAEVRLIGKNTGMSKAQVTGQDVATRIETERGTLALNGLVQIGKIGLPGDGGAPVLDSQNRLIGLLAASSSEHAFVLPVKDFYEKKQLRLLP
jgi:hypothetical protein